MVVTQVIRVILHLGSGFRESVNKFPVAARQVKHG